MCKFEFTDLISHNLLGKSFDLGYKFKFTPTRTGIEVCSRSQQVYNKSLYAK